MLRYCLKSRALASVTLKTSRVRRRSDRVARFSLLRTFVFSSGAFIALALAGCEFIAPSGVFECSGAAADECPPNYRCVEGLCVSSDEPSIDEGESCPPLEAPANGFIDQNGEAAIGARVNFSCDIERGFALVGEPSLLCGEGGVWSGAPPICEERGCAAGMQPDPLAPEICMPCPEGRFSSAAGNAPCEYWSVCEEYALEWRTPSATSDRVCFSRWATQFGVGNGTYVESMKLGPEGDLYVAGFLDEEGAEDGFVARYSPSGERVWLQTNPSNGADDLAIDAEGFIYIVGWAKGALPGQVSQGLSDAYLEKYDAEGELIWTRQFGTSGSDSARSVAIGADGEIYVAGSTDGEFPGQTKAGGSDVFFSRFTPEGELVWLHQFGSSARDAQTGLVVDEEGAIYIAGETNGKLPGLGVQHQGETDVFVRKYDAEGEFVWHSAAASLQYDRATSLRLAPDGSLLLTGYTNGRVVGWSAAPTNQQAFLIKIRASDGYHIWGKQFGEPYGYSGADTDVSSDGQVHFFGSAAVEGENDQTIRRAFIRTYDLLSGAERWTHFFGASGHVRPSSGAVADDGSIFIAGYISDGAFPGFSYAAGHGEAFIAGFMAPEDL